MVDAHSDTVRESAPVLPGMHPDPSICRVGDEYFSANSSFEYLPGVPIHRSVDLVSWELIGHALTTEQHLVTTPGIAGASKGVYAPTLRHHDGTFFLVTTDIDRVRDGHLIVHATDPAGPWSIPVMTEGALGIDPDLAWDDDGNCYLTWRDLLRGGIAQALVDPLTGLLLAPPQSIWEGTGLSETEGPHLYKRGEWWYLIAAEGGTHTGHSVVVARSDSPSGPFESHPANPILSNRSTSHPVQATGHADLVERADGSWAALYHGIRQFGSFPRFHVMGRETFVSDVEWAENWPVFIGERSERSPADNSFHDTFSDSDLHGRWVAPGHYPVSFARPAADGLLISSDPGTAILCTRVRDREWTASVTLSQGDGTLVVRIDDEHEFAISRRAQRASVDLTVGSVRTRLAEAPIGADVHLVLAAEPSPPRGFRLGPDTLRAGLRDSSGTRWLAEIDGRYLSTEVAGGFTGRMLGLHALGGDAVFGAFRYDAPVTGASSEGSPV